MTIEAMKQALAVLEEIADEVFSPYDNKLGDAILALRAAIKEAEKQEPVAWVYHGIRHDDTPHERPSLIWRPEYMDAMSAEKGAKASPLYAAPRSCTAEAAIIKESLTVQTEELKEKNG